MKRLRPDLQVIDFRGNVETRPAKIERGVADGAFWATLVAGAVVTAVAAGVAIGAVTVDQEVETWVFDSTHTEPDRQARADLAQSLAIAGDVLGSIGGATLVTAVVLFLARERTYEIWPESDDVAIGIDLGPGHAGLRLGGTF